LRRRETRKSKTEDRDGGRNHIDEVQT
jgi:hypothetical protein